MILIILLFYIIERFYLLNYKIYILYSYVRICFEESLSLDPRNRVCVCVVYIQKIRHVPCTRVALILFNV